jgi:hypothetical protein
MAVSSASNGYNIASGIIVTTPSASFTRPNNTTAYASGNLVANSVTAGSVVPLKWALGRVPNGTFLVRRVKMYTSSTSVTLTTFNVHFYQSSPTCANGDGAAWSTTTSGWIGSIQVPVANWVAFTDGAAGMGAAAVGLELNGACAAGSTFIYGLVQAGAAYTPTANEVITVVPEVWQN